jgi:hypothetical protein
MNLKRTALVLILGAASLGAMSATANAQPVREPTRYEAVAHVNRQRHEIRQEARRGEISPMQAHRMLAADHRIARHARMHGGHLTRVEHRHLHRHDVRLHRHS